MIAPHRHDPDLCYSVFTQHIRRCPDCAVHTDMCEAAREFLHAWGEAERAENRLTETDAFMDSDLYTAHPEDRLEAEA